MVLRRVHPVALFALKSLGPAHGFCEPTELESNNRFTLYELGKERSEICGWDEIRRRLSNKVRRRTAARAGKGRVEPTLERRPPTL